MARQINLRGRLNTNHLLRVENCHLPRKIAAPGVVQTIRHIGEKFGRLKIFNVYFEVQEGSSRLQKIYTQLASLGVSVKNCPHNGKKDVVDKAILGEGAPLPLDATLI
jgi:hypothetical protein